MENFSHIGTKLVQCYLRTMSLKRLYIKTQTDSEHDNALSPDHQFSNGCHAPPWQQVHGDISYLDIKPFDSDKLTVTANTAGYFVNKGLTQEGQVNFERVGDVYPTLVALLKAKSPQFSSAIEKKVFFKLMQVS